MWQSAQNTEQVFWLEHSKLKDKAFKEIFVTATILSFKSFENVLLELEA